MEDNILYSGDVITTDILLNYTNTTTDVFMEDEYAPGFHSLLTMDYVNSTIFLAVCLFGLIGNGVAMAVVLFNPNMRTPSNVLIFNLALTDFLFLLSLPFTVTLIIKKEWLFGPIMCKIHFGCFGINVYAGIYTIVLMSFDRYIAVCKNKWHSYRTVANSIVCCVLVWVVTILLMLPLLLYARHDKEIKACYLDWPTSGEDRDNDSAPAFTLYTLILGFFIPLIIIIVFYILILIRLRRHMAQTKNSMIVQTKRRTRRVTLLVFGIIMTYLVCWTPYWGMQILVLTKGKHGSLSDADFTAYHISSILYHCNSMLNPILYGFLSVSFRKGVVMLLKCERVSRKNSQQRPSRSSVLVNHRSLKMAGDHDLADHSALLANRLPPMNANLLSVFHQDLTSSKQSLETNATYESDHCLNESQETDVQE